MCSLGVPVLSPSRHTGPIGGREDAARGERYARQFGAALFPSYEALLAEGPAAVLVCSENSKHRRAVEMAAAAGAHVLCEKPLATTLEDGRAMMDACARAGVRLMTAFPMRFSAPLREIKDRLDAGELGQVLCCNATNQAELPKRHREWFVDPELAGGGAVMDHTVHLADVLRWYLDSEVVEVYAQTNQILHAGEVEVETGGLPGARVEFQRDFLKQTLERPGGRLGLRQQGCLDGVRERPAVLLRLLQLAARVRVLIAAAAGDEEGRRTRVSLLEIALGVAGVVGTDLVEVLPEGGVVARVAEEHGPEFAVGAVDSQDRHVVIHGAIRVGVDAVAALR